MEINHASAYYYNTIDIGPKCVNKYKPFFLLFTRSTSPSEFIESGDIFLFPYDPLILQNLLGNRAFYKPKLSHRNNIQTPIQKTMRKHIIHALTNKPQKPSDVILI